MTDDPDGKGLMDRVIDWTLTGDLRRRVLALIIIGCVLYGATIALDALVLRHFFSDVFSENSDLSFYRFRGESILDGKIPYVDFTSESPPLIMYMFVVPQLTGGSTLSYQVFFAFFSILTSLLLYLGFRQHDERKAMMAGLAYLAYPLCLMEFAIGVQDEAITTFLFLLPLVLLHLGRGWASGVTSLVGVLTKMFNVLLVPWMFLQADRRNRIAILVSFVGLALLILVPLMILFPDQLPSFRYYFLGNPDSPTGGSSISPWHYLGKLGYGLPGWAGMTLALVGLGGATMLAFKWKLTLWQGSALVIMVFFLFYPKILMAYFIMPITLLMMWGLEDRKTMLKLFAVIVPLFASMTITGNGMAPVSDEPWVWLLGMALSLVGWGLMLHTWWKIKDKKVFFERD
ncbi:MAG: glycosyltransferase 87 family protein [Methanomassiliicoccales archaeon]|nr:glycosyltransferase 87 family protein [Methanomassiliicoccales archaeon]